MGEGNKRVASIEWDFYDQALDINQIYVVEKYLGCRFPEDYVSVVKKYSGGHPNLDCFDFYDHEESVFNYLLSFNSERSIYILKVYEDVKDRLQKNLVPIANDPFGNLICFDYSKNSKEPAVVFWDHEIAYEDRNQATSFICNTFTELLNKLYQL